jgi:hypothetical protein
LATTENLLSLKIHKLSQAQYDRESAAGNLDPNALYLTPEQEIAEVADDKITLSEQFTITKDFGYYTLNGATSRKIGTIGQSLHSFLQGAFANEDKTIFSIVPSFGITISGSTEGEIGSTVTPTASWNNKAGTYKWGTMKGDTPNYSDKTTGISYTTGTISATKGTLNSPITFTATGQTVSVKGSSTRSAVTKHPISNIGSDIYADLASEYKSSTTNNNVTQSKTFTGYRKMFMGATASTATLSSSLIRSLSGEKAAKTSKVVTASADAKHTKIIWAIPTSLTTNTPTFKYWFNNEWHTLSGVSSATTVKVQGANGEAGENYNIYVYQPAGGIFEADMTTQITIN